MTLGIKLNKSISMSSLLYADDTVQMCIRDRLTSDGLRLNTKKSFTIIKIMKNYNFFIMLDFLAIAEADSV